MCKRLFDVSFGIFLLVVSCPLLLLIVVGIKLTSRGPAIFWSERVGLNDRPFLMPKFRTMYLETPEVASNHLSDPLNFITPLGRILRKTSFDELPQIWSVIKGDMSLIGPRPVIAAERELVRLRRENGVYSIRPGITGWAQVNGRDFMTINRKVELDTYYLQNRSFSLDIQILLKTAKKVLKAADIIH